MKDNTIMVPEGRRIGRGKAREPQTAGRNTLNYTYLPQTRAGTREEEGKERECDGTLCPLDEALQTGVCGLPKVVAADPKIQPP